MKDEIILKEQLEILHEVAKFLSDNPVTITRYINEYIIKSKNSDELLVCVPIYELNTNTTKMTINRVDTIENDDIEEMEYEFEKTFVDECQTGSLSTTEWLCLLNTHTILQSFIDIYLHNVMDIDMDINIPVPLSVFEFEYILKFKNQIEVYMTTISKRLSSVLINNGVYYEIRPVIIISETSLGRIMEIKYILQTEYSSLSYIPLTDDIKTEVFKDYFKIGINDAVLIDASLFNMVYRTFVYCVCSIVSCVDPSSDRQFYFNLIGLFARNIRKFDFYIDGCSDMKPKILFMSENFFNYLDTVSVSLVENMSKSIVNFGMFRNDIQKNTLEHTIETIIDKTFSNMNSFYMVDYIDADKEYVGHQLSAIERLYNLIDLSHLSIDCSNKSSLTRILFNSLKLLRFALVGIISTIRCLELEDILIDYVDTVSLCEFIFDQWLFTVCAIMELSLNQSTTKSYNVNINISLNNDYVDSVIDKFNNLNYASEIESEYKSISSTIDSDNYNWVKGLNSENIISIRI